MQVTRKNCLAASGIVAVAAMLVMFSPRRAEGQYASPVKIMNTSSAPGVVSSIDDPGRTPYQSGQTFPCTGTACTANFGTVPAGHRLVIQSAAGLFNVSPTSGPELLVMLVHQSNPSAVPLPVPIPIVGTGAFGSGQIQVYVDAGQPISVDIGIGGATFGAMADVVLSGYMLDCSANSCAPIAH